jgi:hypothetical protein
MRTPKLSNVSDTRNTNDTGQAIHTNGTRVALKALFRVAER